MTMMLKVVMIMVTVMVMVMVMVMVTYKNRTRGPDGRLAMARGLFSLSLSVVEEPCSTKWTGETKPTGHQQKHVFNLTNLPAKLLCDFSGGFA